MSKQINWPTWIVCQSRFGLAVAYGPSGDGKTEIMQHAAKVFDNRDYYQFVLSGESREDVKGFPTPAESTIAGVKRRCVVTLKSEIFLKAQNEHTLVHLDEINHTPRPVFGAVHDEWINQFPGDALVVATANPPEMSTDGQELPVPVVNRCCILDWEDHYDDWLEGMAKGEFPDPEIPLLPSNWKDYAAKWRNIIVEYAGEYPEEFDRNRTFPKSEEEGAKPWRSKRSWCNLAMNLAAAESVGATLETSQKIIRGFIGVGPQRKFTDWLNIRGYPSAAELLDDPKLLELPKRFDLAVGISVSALAETKRRIDSGERPGESWEKSLDFCEEVFRQNREVGLTALGSFVELMPYKHQAKARGKTFQEMSDLLTGN